MIEETSSGMLDVAVTLLGPRYAWPKCWTECNKLGPLSPRVLFFPADHRV